MGGGEREVNFSCLGLVFIERDGNMEGSFFEFKSDF